MKLLYWLVKNKANSREEVPIYCRITVNGVRAELSTDVSVKLTDFDLNKKRVRGNNEEAIIKNQKLDSINYKLINIYNNAVFNGLNPTAGELKRMYSDKRLQISKLSDLLTHYANEINDIKPHVERFKKHIRFINIINSTLLELKKKDIMIDQCDHYILEQLAYNIVEEQEYSVSYTYKLFFFLRKAVEYAFNRRYAQYNYIGDYKLSYRIIYRIKYLEEFEVEKILKHDFEGNLQHYADLFLVQCYTGLSYIDLMRFKVMDLIKDNEGLIWINIVRKKEESAECVIPVIGKVWRILKKYNFELPHYSNQKYNDALKRISTEVGIKEHLTTHVGRKTYGTLLLNKDVPIETVSALLGHSNVQTTQRHYAKVLKMKMARDVRNVI